MNRNWVTAIVLALGLGAHSRVMAEGVAVCPGPAPSQAVGSNLDFLDSVAKTAPDVNASFKSKDELDEYLSQHYGDFRSPVPKTLPQDRAYIGKAASAFNVPEAILTCLILKESNYDPLTISSRDAIGLSQITPDTLDTINNYLAGRVKGFDAQELKAGWQSYWTATFPGRHAPVHLTTSDLRNPAIAIGVGALWYRYGYDYLMKQKEPDTCSQAGSWILAAGGYNIGVGGIVRFCPQLEMNACIASLDRKKIKETELYMIRIRSCATPGDFNRIDGRKSRNTS